MRYLLLFILSISPVFAQEDTQCIPISSVEVDGTIITLRGPDKDIIAEYILCEVDSESTDSIPAVTSTTHYTTEYWKPWPDVEFWVTRKVKHTTITIDKAGK